MPFRASFRLVENAPNIYCWPKGVSCGTLAMARGSPSVCAPDPGEDMAQDGENETLYVIDRRWNYFVQAVPITKVKIVSC